MDLVSYSDKYCLFYKKSLRLQKSSPPEFSNSSTFLVRAFLVAPKLENDPKYELTLVATVLLLPPSSDVSTSFSLNSTPAKSRSSFSFSADSFESGESETSKI